MTNLKCCPFCGAGDMNMYSNYSSKHRCYFVFVKCNVCGASTRTYSTPDDPIDNDWSSSACLNAAMAWNRRGGKSDA